MGAFILAGVVFVATLGASALVLMGNMMSDSPGISVSAAPMFLGGTATAGIILASHWMPAIGW